MIHNMMDIRAAIEKATQIPKTNGDASFVRLKKPDQATLDRNMNKRKLKTPRNIKLLDDDPHSVESYGLDKNYSCTLSLFNACEISTDVKSVNGGISYSNKSVEDHWKSKQLDHNFNLEHSNASTSSSESSYSCRSVIEVSNVQDTKSNETKENTENSKDSNTVQKVLKTCKLSKNAVILGLLNNNKITLEDLQIPTTSNVKTEKSQNQSDTQTDDAVGQYLLQHPDEPDVYIHSLQMMERLQKSKSTTPDFVVDHVGVKKTITPRQYYIKETDEMSFEFVKKKNLKDK